MSSSSRPDLQGFAFAVHGLVHAVGEARAVERTCAAPEAFGNGVLGVKQSDPIRLDITLQAVSDGILAGGAVELSTTGECVRCLEPITEEHATDIQELFVTPEKDPEEDLGRIVDDTIDLFPVIRDQVVLELPFAPLCADDCPGLCPTCGVRLAANPDHRHEQIIDERWAALEGLLASNETAAQPHNKGE